jgi:hypothetical protein
MIIYIPMQRFSLLGSTGSIGTQTLDIIAEFPEKFELVAMAAGSNVELMAKQVSMPAKLCVLRYRGADSDEIIGSEIHLIVNTNSTSKATNLRLCPSRSGSSSPRWLLLKMPASWISSKR